MVNDYFDHYLNASDSSIFADAMEDCRNSPDPVSETCTLGKFPCNDVSMGGSPLEHAMGGSPLEHAMHAGKRNKEKRSLSSSNPDKLKQLTSSATSFWQWEDWVSPPPSLSPHHDSPAPNSQNSLAVSIRIASQGSNKQPQVVATAPAAVGFAPTTRPPQSDTERVKSRKHDRTKDSSSNRGDVRGKMRNTQPPSMAEIELPMSHSASIVRAGDEPGPSDRALSSSDNNPDVLSIFEKHGMLLFAEEISDSGISLSSTKPSSAAPSSLSSSENNSPTEISSPPAVGGNSPLLETAGHTPSSSARSGGHFSYPSLLESGISRPLSPQEETEPSLLDPIPEPFPSLASDREYMVLTPQLRPPSPPPFTEGLDLHPTVEMYEVSGGDSHGVHVYRCGVCACFVP